MSSMFCQTGTVKMASGCCGYGAGLTGKTATGFDCAIIPGASKFTSMASVLTMGIAYGFCGGEFGTSSGATAAATVCCEFPCTSTTKKTYN